MSGRRKIPFVITIAALALGACDPVAQPRDSSDAADDRVDDEAFTWVVRDDLLPPSTQGSECLDAAFFDMDSDGDLDLFLANEFQENILLENVDAQTWRDLSTSHLPPSSKDSEDIAIVDIDGDGDLDVLTVSEDDFENELLLNDGSGRFTDRSDAWPFGERSNAIAFGDLDADGQIDILVGNNGRNRIVAWSQTEDALVERPLIDFHETATQDVEMGDLNGDGTLDIFEANEDDSGIWLSDGNQWTWNADAPLALGADENRDVDLIDVDGDGDLDAFLSRVDLARRQIQPHNRILLNAGDGQFFQLDGLPPDEDFTMDGDFVDADGDGDWDLLTGNYGTLSNPRSSTPVRLFANDGLGNFVTWEQGPLPPVSAHGFDIEVGDVNGDGHPDIYVCSGRSADRLLLSDVP